MQKTEPVRVLFVCLGNICRSPSAEGMMAEKIRLRQLTATIEVDSCGTAPFNIGKSPDKRAIDACLQLGFDISHQIARQIEDDDYTRFDYIIPMDRKNKMSIDAWKPRDFKGTIELLKAYHPHPSGDMQIADPYQESEAAFLPRMRIIEESVDGLIEHILNTL